MSKHHKTFLIFMFNTSLFEDVLYGVMLLGSLVLKKMEISLSVF